MAFRAFAIEDFTGGLNLRADVFNLDSNESPDLLNVDIDPRGGVFQRRGLQRWGTGNVAGVLPQNWGGSVNLFFWESGTPQVLLSGNDTIYYSDDGTFTDTTISTASSAFGAGFSGWSDGSDDVVYVACGCATGSHKWDGAAKTSLTSSGTGNWQDNLLSPTTGFMPSCHHVATHSERLWVAYTREDAVDYPDRVRFSHPLFPESWREQDYIDIVGGGRGITALVPYSGHILVFKEHAVYAIFGYSDDTFQVVTITEELGAVSPSAVAQTEEGIFFFDGQNGLFKYDGRSVQYMFEALRPLFDINEFHDEALAQVKVSAVNRKVYVSLPTGVSTSSETYGMIGVGYRDSSILYAGGGLTYDAIGVTYDDNEVKWDGATQSDDVTVTYVWDSTLSKNGAWTKYQIADGFGLGAGTIFVDSSSRTYELFAHPTKPQVFYFDRTLHTDNVLGYSTPFTSFYVTSWQDAGSASTKKFWRRPEFVLNREYASYDLNVAVYRDWDSLTLKRQFDVPSAGYGGAGSPSQWVSSFGSEVARGNSLGLGRAVQLKISGPESASWGVNGVTFNYNPRGYKP